MQGNRQQQEAIVWDRGPALVLAGPGSGKTFTIVERVRYLIEVRKADPSRILVITFTKAAACQMRDRFFARMEGVFHPVTFGTFHAVFFQILKSSRRYASGRIVSEREKREYLRTVLQALEAGIAQEEGMEEGLLSEIGFLKNAGKIPADFHSAFLEMPLFKKVFMGFQGQLFGTGRLDLDDFAAAAEHLLLTDRQVLEAWGQRFSYILMDEFQDINAVQYRVMKLLAGKEGNLFAVGDDDQAIYGFRGSDPAIMRQFVQDFPAVRQITLSVNYRCSTGIVETAGKLIATNRQRFPKKITAGKAAKAGEEIKGEPGTRAPWGREGEAGIWKPLSKDRSVQIGSFLDRRQQAAAVCGRIRNFCEKEPAKTIAAIFRTNTDCVLLAEALGEVGIAFSMKEKIKNPYEHPVCQDLLAYLRFAKVERSRRDFLKIMNKPCRYIARQKVGEGQVSFPALCSAYREKPYMQPVLLKMQADIGRIAGLDLYAAINYVRRGAGYDEHMKKEWSGEAYTRAVEAADFLQESVRRFGSVERLEEHMEAYRETLLASAKKEENTEHAVCLMTMHGAKGLEYDVVFLPDCNEGIVPHKKSVGPDALEEERRMFYVGMTRAKERLYLGWVCGTPKEPGFPSRFLAECGYREGYRST